MPDEVRIDKIPRYCADTQSLQAGDILIFDYVSKIRGRAKNHSEHFTVHQQGFLNEVGGHSQATHAGFVVQTETGLKFAHLVGAGFMLDDLNPDSDGYCKYLNRTTHVYRPRKHAAAIAAELEELVRGVELAKGDKLLNEARAHRNAKSTVARVRWKLRVGIGSFLTRLVSSLKIINHNPGHVTVHGDKDLPDNVISNESICSRFVAEAYISACHRATNKDPEKLNYRMLLMNISQHTLPKTLQAYLYRNTNYDYFVMPHSRLARGPYEGLKEIIHQETHRMFRDIDIAESIHRPLTQSEQKALDLISALNQFDGRDDLEQDEMRRTIALMKVLMPILKRNTGMSAVTPKSYRRVMVFAKAEGIYNDNFKYDLHDRTEKKITALAVEKYSFNPPLAKLYRNYRRIGYSDNEAKFECKPTFGDWFKISPVRNGLLTATLFGFLFWVLPRGLTRVKQAAKRNLHLEDHAQQRPAM